MRVKRTMVCIFLLGAGVLPLAGRAEEAVVQQRDYLKVQAESMESWKDARFGMFIHWGPVSLTGGEIGWSRGGERRGQGGTGPTPVEVYDNLYKKFNPVKFDADEWVQIARDAGMKYLVFTTKHHDGFCMFDSKLTDYKITSPDSPYGKDVVRQLADACHKGGIKLGFYYSPPDWHHPDYRNGERHAKYIEYLHGQLRELLTGYGRVDIIFFDGLGGKAADWDAERLIRMCRRLQPHVVINNRSGLPADYDTPENRVGYFQRHRPWETCATLGTQWAWKPSDRLRSFEECMNMLITCATGDGNLLLNVGPMPDGRIEPQQADRLREMGKWLKQYGESIYATRGGPFRAPDEKRRGQPGYYEGFELAGGRWWGGSTHRGNMIYLHILRWPSDIITLPPIPHKIVKHAVLTGGIATVKQTEQGIEVHVPGEERDPLDTIVKLELDGLASDITPRSVGSGSLTLGKKATASNVYEKQPQHAPDMAVDEDSSTRWATNAGTHQAWLEVDLGEPTTFNRVAIEEAYERRVQKFELQYRDGPTWKTVLSGTTIGRDYSKTFPPVTARHVRLDILEANEGPTIWEFQLFKP